MKRIKKHMQERERVLANQLEKISKDSVGAMGSELKELTSAMCMVLKEMFLPYKLGILLVLVMLFQALISIVVLVKKFFRSQR